MTYTLRAMHVENGYTKVFKVEAETEEAAIDAIETSGPWEVIFHDYYDDF